MSNNFNNDNNNNNKPKTHTRRGVLFLALSAVLILVLAWQLSYHIPKLQKAAENVELSKEAVRLSQLWVDCAQARVNAIEEGTPAPDCTAVKADALRAAARRDAFGN